MGLALSYELRLPASVDAAAVERMLVELRDVALRQGLAEVSPIVRLDGITKPRDKWETLAMFNVDFLSDCYPDGEPAKPADMATAIAFFVNPGEGSEHAGFGLVSHANPDETEREWFWWATCKTQYASNHGDDNFLRCHRGLIAILDHAVKLGIDVTVWDEGEYWETRDESLLLKRVGGMNHLLAAFGGALADSLGEGAVQGPIFEHPRFEHLEMDEE